MISYNYETDFKLQEEGKLSCWVESTVLNENCRLGEINYIFCNDRYLHKLNVEFLEHDTFTDIISFDYSVGNELHGDIFISIDRVTENARKFNVGLLKELRRVMIHGVLHYCGFKDKSEEDSKIMREKENFYLKAYV